MSKLANPFIEEDEPQVSSIALSKRKLITISYDYSVDYIFNLMTQRDPKIILEVPFQRKYIWPEEKASQLIESILLNVPIPPIYLAEEENGKWLVIDGLQRLNAILKFFQNEYPLKKLELITEMEDKKYKDLPNKLADILRDGMLRINIIKNESHPEIKYDIFMRLNKGSVSLNNQELRNCLYRGTLNNTIKELTYNTNFLGILGVSDPHDRFLDAEFVLRYIAFSENVKFDHNEFSINGYGGSLKTFLNNYMENNRNISEEKCVAMKNKFVQTINKVLEVFNKNEAFREPGSKLINKALADCIMIVFEKYDTKILSQNKDAIIKALRTILSVDKFKSSISQKTSDTKNLKYRINEWFKVMNDAI